MANLFLNQAKQYAGTRPAYPMELFEFIASKTPRHDLAWDVGTGSGQAAASLAKLYKDVVGTDTSAQQLSYAPRLPNTRYVHTPPDLPLERLHADVAPPGSVDVVTVAQAFHWLDLPRFYAQARSVLRAAPHGVLAAWCYTEPRVGAAVDAVFWRLYNASQPHWAPNRKMVDDEYRSVDFPFDPVEGEAHTGPSSSPRSAAWTSATTSPTSLPGRPTRRPRRRASRCSTTTGSRISRRRGAATARRSRRSGTPSSLGSVR
ncbi:hypothetical protein ACQ4PT_058440 [Festuca glaucescens]